MIYSCAHVQCHVHVYTCICKLQYIAYVRVCLQGVLSLLGQVEKAAEEKQEKDPDNQAKIAEALEAVKGIRSIAPLVPDLVSREPRTA